MSHLGKTLRNGHELKWCWGDLSIGLVDLTAKTGLDDFFHVFSHCWLLQKLPYVLILLRESRICTKQNVMYFMMFNWISSGLLGMHSRHSPSRMKSRNLNRGSPGMNRWYKFTNPMNDCSVFTFFRVDRSWQQWAFLGNVKRRLRNDKVEIRLD